MGDSILQRDLSGLWRCEKAAGARCFKTDARIVVIGLGLE